MLRLVVASCLILGVSTALGAQEVCVTCTKPDATYRCTFEQATRIELGELAQPHVCKKVLESAGPHANCKVVEGSEPCNGTARTVTVADYQRLVLGDGHPTYQRGMLEKAQDGISSAWGCVVSLFGDC